MLAALSLSMVCFAIEAFSLLTGVSMFNSLVSLLCESALAHSPRPPR